MINKITDPTINKNIASKRPQPSFEGVRKGKIFMDKFHPVVPCRAQKEILILKKLIKLLEKNKIKYLETFETKISDWNHKFVTTGFRKKYIILEKPRRTWAKPKIEYWPNKKTVYSIWQTKKDETILYKVLIEKLQNCINSKETIVPYPKKAKVIQFKQQQIGKI